MTAPSLQMRTGVLLLAVMLVIEAVVAEPCCGRHHRHGGALIAGGLGFAGVSITAVQQIYIRYTQILNLFSLYRT